MKRTYLEYYLELDRLNDEYKRRYISYRNNILAVAFVSLFASILLGQIHILLFIVTFGIGFGYSFSKSKEISRLKMQYEENYNAYVHFVNKYSDYIKEEARWGKKRYYETDSERRERLRREEAERRRSRARERAKSRQNDWYSEFEDNYGFFDGDMFDMFEEFFRKQQREEDFYNNHRRRQQNTWGNSWDYNGGSNRNNQSNSRVSSDKTQNAYTLMKLNRNDNESIIKKKYRELAIKWHPDKWTNDKLENQQIAERNFKKLNNAYELIKKDKGMN